MTEAFFTDEGDGRFAATALTRGPWSPDHQHAGPPTALLGRCLEAAHGREGARIARLTVEILRPVPIGTLDVETQVVRGGRSIELLGAVARCEGQEILRASAWQLRTEPIPLAEPPPAVDRPGPEGLPPGSFFEGAMELGYHTGMAFRFAAGSFAEPGPAAVWMRMEVPLLAGEAPSPLVRVLAAADSGNGVSAVADPRDVLFVNTDLTVSLHRPPAGEWVLIDARTVVEPDGTGQALSRLADVEGTIGTAIQTLFVAPR
jgi:hypothetical protein